MLDAATGQQVVRKHASSDHDRERLEHEAAVLEAARHPGVVELLGAPGDDDGDALTTAWAGDMSLDIAPRTTVQEAAAMVAALADTVADLHGLGLVHGRIEPSHVVLSPGGHPVLCGFAGGGNVGSVPPPASPPPVDYCDPAAPAGVPLFPTADVFGLGALLRDLVVDGAAEGEPIPDRRWPLGRLRPWTGYVPRALLTLADQATADDPERRPTARQLAASIRESTSETTDQARGHRRRLAMAALGLAVVIVVVGSLSSAPPRATVRGTTSTTTPVAPSVPAAAPLGTLPRLRPAGPPPVIVGDGVVERGGQRFSVGETGDVLALGDWDCDGVATPAVLRPSTGSVFRFDRWASADAELTMGPATTIAGAVSLRAVFAEDGCAHLIAVLADGTGLEVTS